MERINYCCQCGTAVEHRIPADDNHVRAVCPACNYIHYSNPKIVVGCLLTSGSKVLLCQRDIEPRINYWTLPAGYMEDEETTQEGALREAQEEACAIGVDTQLFAVYDIPRISHVYMLYRGELRDDYAAAGDETKAIALLEESEIPWDKLAFAVMNEALERHFEDRRKEPNNALSVHRATFIGSPGSKVEIIRA